jgi:bacterioferritin (cytochrome b1)
MVHQQLIGELNCALNREVSAILRHLLQGASITEAELQKVKEIYQREMADELDLAQYLASQIVMLGGTPNLAPDLARPPADVKQMLANDIEQQRQDLRHYMKLASLAEEEGLMDLKLRMEERAENEYGHIHAMHRWLSAPGVDESSAFPGGSIGAASLRRS